MASKDKKPTGLKPPSKIGRPTGIAKPKTSTSATSAASSRAQSKYNDSLFWAHVYWTTGIVFLLCTVIFCYADGYCSAVQIIGMLSCINSLLVCPYQKN